MNHRVILIVEDDPGAVRAIQRFLPSELARRVAPSAARAKTLLAAHEDWLLFLIDVGLGPKESGLDVLEAAIAAHPRVARALVTGNESAEINNHARACSTDVIRKPFGREALAPTIARAISSRSAQGEIAESLTDLALAAGLSPREHEVLGRLVAGERRSELPDALGIAKSTVDSFVRGILAKTAHPAIQCAVSSVLRAAIGRGTERTPY